MKVLFISNLFPNSQEPTRGTYNIQQCQELAKLCEMKIIAPVPWSALSYIFKRGLVFSKVPTHEIIGDFEVYHPRYFMIPKIGRSLYSLFLFLSLYPLVRKIQRHYSFDVIYAPWIYPDAVASQWVARILKKPIVMAALGTDINSYLNYSVRRKLIVHALNGSQGIISVSLALKDKMIAAGVNGSRITTIHNGVNQVLFRRLDKHQCRVKLGINLNAHVILFAGNLVPVKGVSYLIEAFRKICISMNKLNLIIVGEGPLKDDLIGVVKSQGLEDRVFFAGRQAHEVIPLWMNACDVFCLPSINEGCPNVVLEAMACGAYVVATRVGGIPELIHSENEGILVEPCNAGSLENGLHAALHKLTIPQTNLKNHTVKSWEENAKEVFAVLESAVQRIEQC